MVSLLTTFEANLPKLWRTFQFCGEPSCGEPSLWRTFLLRYAAVVKGVVNCQNSRDKGPQKAIVPVGKPRPYSIIILNMRFIPKASLRASSQITASSYILERHLWVNNSKPLSFAPTWSPTCKQTDCITGGFGNCLTPKFVLSPSKHKTFVWLYAMLDQRRRRWADIA